MAVMRYNVKYIHLRYTVYKRLHRNTSPFTHQKVIVYTPKGHLLQCKRWSFARRWMSDSCKVYKQAVSRCSLSAFFLAQLLPPLSIFYCCYIKSVLLKEKGMTQTQIFARLGKSFNMVNLYIVNKHQSGFVASRNHSFLLYNKLLLLFFFVVP